MFETIFALSAFSILPFLCGLPARNSPSNGIVIGFILALCGGFVAFSVECTVFLLSGWGGVKRISESQMNTVFWSTLVACILAWIGCWAFWKKAFEWESLSPVARVVLTVVVGNFAAVSGLCVGFYLSGHSATFTPSWSTVFALIFAWCGCREFWKRSVDWDLSPPAARPALAAIAGGLSAWLAHQII